jgi:DNA-binding MarR family transcriptional regulator
VDINKDLVAASSTPLVLAMRMEWTDGMLYPVLHRLERLGFIEAHWEKSESGRRRKYYRITKRGRTQLAEEREQWQAVDETLRGIWSALALPFHAARRFLTPTFTPAAALCPCR